MQVFHDAEASNSSFSPTHLFAPNWHEAATSSCQSNKLMLPGIDCLPFAIDSLEAAWCSLGKLNFQTHKQANKTER